MTISTSTTTATVCNVSRCLHPQLLPGLHRHLTHKDGDAIMVHTPVALAIVKLLLQLPQATLHEQARPATCLSRQSENFSSS